MADQIDFLVVGLGNPGEEYENTPHNLGFLVMDRLAESHGIRVTRKENFSKVGLGTDAREKSRAGQAADVHESERPGGKGAARTVRINTRPFDCGV